MKCWLFLLILIFNYQCPALEVSNGKTQVRETKDRAQLSLVLQISDEENIPTDSSYEKELLHLIRDSLQKALLKKQQLKHHQHFTHIFVTALANSFEEEVLAMFAKTPQDKFPIINIFRNNTEETEEDDLSLAKLKAPPAGNMFEQVQNQRQNL